MLSRTAKTLIMMIGLFIAGSGAGAQVYVFQDGANGYNNTLDTFLELDYDLAHGIDGYISIDCWDANVVGKSQMV
jgi:hypothetical protein